LLATVWIPALKAQQANPVPQHQNNPETYKQGTKQNPVAIDIIRTAEPDGSAEQQNKDREEKRVSDNRLIGIGIVQCIIFGFQLWVFGRQATRLRETVKEMEKGTKATQDLARAADGQTLHMERYIGEAARSAAAMERVSESIATSAQAATESVATSKEIAARQKNFGQMQMRAYLSVVIGTGIYQDKKRNIFFEVLPTLINNGYTPAHKVTYKARAGILPYPLPESTTLEPPENLFKSAAVLGPRQTFTLNAPARSPVAVDGFFTDEEVELIKRGTIGQRLYIWGTVTYEDVFGVPRFTNFCHSIVWVQIKNGKTTTETVYGHYASRHNDAD